MNNEDFAACHAYIFQRGEIEKKNLLQVMKKQHFQTFVSVVQNRITAYWFKNKELALAFGITLAFSRLGSVLNFFLTQNFKDMYGLSWTLWGGNDIIESFQISHLPLLFLIFHGHVY